MKCLSLLIAASLSGAIAAHAQQSITIGPKHRYRFDVATGPLANGAQLPDSIGTAHGSIRGTGASANGTGVRITGGSSATAPYLDLPNASVSGSAEMFPGLSDASYEIWVTVHSNQNWARIIDFGNNSTDEVTAPGGTFNGSDYLIVSASIGNANNIRFERGGQFLTGGGQKDINGATVLGTRMHLVATYSNAASAWKLHKNGVEVASIPTLLGPSTIDDLNVWLGRSNWAADANADATYDEFRIYDYALTTSQILGNYQAGPDVLPSDNPVAQPPVFTGNPLVKPPTIVGSAYADTLAVDASDPNPHDTLVFSKVSGPPWLTVASNGAISGTPGAADDGANSFTVRATDPGGLFAETVVNITVTPLGTVAWWDFEDGVNGAAFTPAGAANGSGGSVDKQAGILMRGWNSTGGPSWTSSTSPNGGSLSMNVAGNQQDGYVTSGALHGWSPKSWTIECTVFLRELAGWETLIGRDGSTQGEPQGDFYLQNNGVDDKFRLNLDTVGGQRWTLDGNQAVQVNTWYALAVMSDGVTLSMWLDDGTGYKQVGSLDISSQTVANNALPASNLSWTFGRGWFNGSFVDHIDGRLDNIRFSNGKLSAAQLIPLSPPPAAPGGLVATAASGSKIDLSWAASPGAATYTVKRSTSASGPFTTIGAGTAGTTFSDTGLNAGTTYHYVVASVNAASASGPDGSPVSASTWTLAQSWRSAHFGTIANAGDAADHADPDGDSVVNLLERAFAGDPKVRESDLLPYLDDNAARLTIVYRKAHAAPDLTVTVQESTDLAGPWTNAAGSGTVLLNDSVVQRIIHHRPAGTEDKLFLRIKVSAP
jgi:hypothetical protein